MDRVEDQTDAGKSKKNSVPVRRSTREPGSVGRVSVSVLYPAVFEDLKIRVYSLHTFALPPVLFSSISYFVHTTVMTTFRMTRKSP